jgi:hypothetical protein
MGNTCCKEDYLDDDEYRYPCKKINFKDMYLISIYENQELKQEIEQPEIEQPEIEQPEIERPEIEQPEIEQPEIEKVKPEQPEIEQNQEANLSNYTPDERYETNSDDSYEILSNEHFKNE